MENKYYFNQLNKEEQRIYYAILEGLQNLEASFAVPAAEPQVLARVYFMVRMDHPEIFYSVTFTYRYYQNSQSYEMVPTYMFEKKKIIEHKKALESRVKKLCLPAAKMNEKEKELYIHDFICQNITYDKLKKQYSHEIIGALTNGVAVCEGISKAVKVLCDNLGIWCILAMSENNPEKGIKYRHMWNVVKIGGKYYHLDATFDNSLGKGGPIRYDYFNIGDKMLFRDHERLVYRVPECTDEKSGYYAEKKLGFTKLEDVENRARQAAKKGKLLTFQWRGGYLTKEILKDILDRINSAGAERAKRAKVSLNWPQAVISVEYIPIQETENLPAGASAGAGSETIPEADVTIQEANEGELYEAGEM